MFISSSTLLIMSNVISYTIYSSVENGRLKLKEAEKFVIKLYYPFIFNCCGSQFTSMIKSNRSSKNTYKVRLIPNSLLGSVLCQYCSPWYIIPRRISLIELCNPSVADPEGVAPSLQYPHKNLLIWAFICSRKHFKP